jgi:hypothetical protein
MERDTDRLVGRRKLRMDREYTMAVAFNDVGRVLNASPRELGRRRPRVAPFIGYDLRSPEASSLQAEAPPSAASWVRYFP